MRLLLDTHVLIWALLYPGRLNQSHMAIVRDASNDVMFSAVNIWEIAIKAGLRRPDFADVDPERMLAVARLDFEELPVTSSAAARVASLPLHHRDPFDRVLIAQAIEADAVLLTADAVLPAYGDRVLLTR